MRQQTEEFQHRNNQHRVNFLEQAGILKEQLLFLKEELVKLQGLYQILSIATNSNHFSMSVFCAESPESKKLQRKNITTKKQLQVKSRNNLKLEKQVLKELGVSSFGELLE